METSDERTRSNIHEIECLKIAKKEEGGARIDNNRMTVYPHEANVGIAGLYLPSSRGSMDFPDAKAGPMANTKTSCEGGHIQPKITKRTTGSENYPAH